MNGHVQELTSGDLMILERSYITPDLARQAGLFRADTTEGGRIVGRNGSGNYAGIVFPYRWPGEPQARAYRLRRDKPELEQKSNGTLAEKGKYLSAPGDRNLLYFAPSARTEWLQDTSLPIPITEGEKKTLALSRLAWHDAAGDRPRFLPVGLSGVWNWRGTIGKTGDEKGARRDVKGPIPDFDLITWKGRLVYIIFDVDVRTNDKVGAARLALTKELRRRGAIVRWVNLPQVEGVNGVDDLLAIRGPNFVLELIGSESEAPIRVAEGAWTSTDEAREHTWPEPKALPDELLPVPCLSPHLLPASLRDWLVDIGERMQCPIEFPAIAALVAAGMLIGNRLQIRPKALDTWSVVPNLWGAIVGKPGVLKSPALEEALGPLRARERMARVEYASALEEYQFDKEFSEAKRKNLRKQMEKGGADKLSLRREYEEAGLSEPSERRYITNDPTTEKLGELLNKNPRGLLLFRDELTGWFRSLDRDGREQDRTFFLETWNGKGGYTYDRIGRGTLRIESLTVSILGGIQPARIQPYVRDALAGAGNDDGLIQRFQLLVYPDIVGSWRNVDNPPDASAAGLAQRSFAQLDMLDGEAIGASLYLSPEGSNYYYVRFDGEAQEFFDGWRADLEVSLRSGIFEHPALEAHMAKYRKLMPALSLIFHLLDQGTNKSTNVTAKAAKLAAAWCTFLEAHAERIYGLVTSGDVGRAKQILRHIRKGNLAEQFTARDIYRRQLAGLTKSEEVRDALNLLAEFGWLRQVAVSAGELGGHPTLLYLAHTSLISAKETD